MENEDIKPLFSLIEKHNLCDKCLGRMFHNLKPMITEEEKGKCIRNFLSMFFNVKLGEVDERNCEICKGVFLNLEGIMEEVKKKISEYEAETFEVGTTFPPDVIKREEEIIARENLIHAESIKSNFNNKLSEMIKKEIGLAVDHESPHLLINVNAYAQKVSVKASPLFIYGRYRKLLRGIPQATWTCKKCSGKGCPACNGTGKIYKESVQDLISHVLLEEAKAKKSKFHGAGREDIDARMLGRGRPFVIELINPKKRKINLEELEKEINKRNKGKIEIIGLTFTNRDKKREVKVLSEKAIKKYRALIEIKPKVDEGDVQKLDKLENLEIMQRTPTRVLSRRKDKVRRKRVYEVKAKTINDRRMELTITCDGGLYVKELINGDSGRTTPSISEILNKKAECTELDVIDIMEAP